MKYGVITIGREYCTGGLDIARAVAGRLGVPMYDKELITLAAKESGLSEEAIAASEKRRTGSLLYSLYTMGGELPLSDQVFVLQSQIIRGLADKGPCVIVGRCGDYVLRERADVLSVFLHAPQAWRREWAKKDGSIPPRSGRENGQRPAGAGGPPPRRLLQLLHRIPLGGGGPLRPVPQRGPGAAVVRRADPAGSRGIKRPPFPAAFAAGNDLIKRRDEP